MNNWQALSPARHLVALVTLILSFTLIAETAAAQGFSLRPMRVEADIRPGRPVTIPFTFTSTTSALPQIVSVEIIDLIQTSDGNWRGITEDDGVDLSGFARSSSWLSVPFSELELGTGESRTFEVEARMPADATGVHLAALSITSRPLGEEDASLRLQVRFLVPIILAAEGRPAVQEISLSRIEMLPDPEAEDDAAAPPDTFVVANVQNTGQTYSRVSGGIRLERQIEDNWRLVTRSDIPERGIIPGMLLELPLDLERSLPSGTYRLTGNMTVDGRPLPRLVEELEFEGAPGADAVAFDTALILDPPLIEMDVVPGATRTTVLSIENPSDQAIDVVMEAVTPDGLRGVAMGDLLGSELSAEPWTQVAPTSFTLQPFGRRNVRVLSRVPNEDLDQRFYYADLVLSGTYPDGQSAGETRSTLTVLNDAVEAAPRGVIDRLTIAAAADPSSYVISARFVNAGNAHGNPGMRARLLSEDGAEILTADLDGAAGLLLPLGIRDFGAALDVSGVPPGAYLLEARGSMAGQTATRSLPVEITLEGQVREMVVRAE
ncbi:MAG: hypothetical protein AAF913_12795 [Pseudomonadota bacterium]